MKRIGTREEVYNGIAIQTAGGMRKDDIMIKKINGKTEYISRRISTRMKNYIISNGGIRKSGKTNKKTMVGGKTRKRVKIMTDKNRVKEYYCPELDYDLDEQHYFDSGRNSQSDEFIIEEVPDIDLDQLFG